MTCLSKQFMEDIMTTENEYNTDDEEQDEKEMCGIDLTGGDE